MHFQAVVQSQALRRSHGHISRKTPYPPPSYTHHTYDFLNSITLACPAGFSGAL